jgi:hypothetical protein
VFVLGFTAALLLMAAHTGAAIDEMPQKSAVSQKEFCILWVNGASDGKMV